MAILRKNLSGTYILMTGFSNGFFVSECKNLIRFGKNDISKTVDFVYDTLESAIFNGKKNGTTYKTKATATKKLNSFFS